MLEALLGGCLRPARDKRQLAFEAMRLGFGAVQAGYERPDQFVATHGMAVDLRGDIYVGEVSYTAWPQIYPDKDIPKGLRTLRKLIRMQ